MDTGREGGSQQGTEGDRRIKISEGEVVRKNKGNLRSKMKQSRG